MYQVFDFLNVIEQDIVNVPMDAYEMADIFQEQLEDYGIEVTTMSAGDVLEDDMVTCNGYYDPSEWDEKENIELVLVVKDEDKIVNINSENWSLFIHQVCQTLQHEMIHRDQYTKKQGMPSPYLHNLQGMTEDQKHICYLSDPDEIDAYSNDLVLDLLRFYSYPDALNRLRTYKRITQEESPIICDYIDTFGAHSETVKLLVKKAIKRLEQ